MVLLGSSGEGKKTPAVSRGGGGSSRRRARAGPGPRVVLAREPGEDREPGGFSPMAGRLTVALRLRLSVR